MRIAKNNWNVLIDFQRPALFHTTSKYLGFNDNKKKAFVSIRLTLFDRPNDTSVMEDKIITILFGLWNGGLLSVVDTDY